MALRVPFALNTQHLAAFHPHATIRNGRFRSFRLTTKPSRLTLQACLPSSSESTFTFRPLANFPSDIWNKYFTSMLLDVSAEQKRVHHVPSGVQCYMKEYGVSKEAAVQELQKMIENAWKDMNEACMRPTNVPRALLNIPFNIARFIEAMYIYGDGYSYQKQMEELITEMFAERIPV